MLTFDCTLLACHWLMPSRMCFPANVTASAVVLDCQHDVAAVQWPLGGRPYRGTQLVQSSAGELSVVAVCRPHKSGPSVFFRPVVAAWGDVQWETAKVSERKQAASGVSNLTEL